MKSFKKISAAVIALAMITSFSPVTGGILLADEAENPASTEAAEETEETAPETTKAAEKKTSKEPKATDKNDAEVPEETEAEKAGETKETEPQETKETEETKDTEASSPDETEPSEPSESAGSATEAEEKLPEQTAKVKRKNANSGSLGKSVTWSFDDSTGTITISGTGAIPKYCYLDQKYPAWSGFKDDIKEVVIKKGITSIGNDAFRRCSNLTTVTFPEGLKTIGEYAFDSCSSIKEITVQCYFHWDRCFFRLYQP